MPDATLGDEVSPAGEFDLIEALLAEQPPQPPALRLGPGDDAAIVTPPPGHELVSTVDVLVAGTHFLADMSFEDIAARALAVNLSDLAAMGADPGPCLLAVTHPALTRAAAAALGRGFAEAARGTGAYLAGGNLARGPFSIGVTAIGWVPAGRGLTRAGARPGDRLCVSGCIGEAGQALEQLRGSTGPAAAGVSSYLRPTARVALGRALRDVASACVDVSDGLLADLAHLLAASGVSARLDLDRVPVAGPVRTAITAGDDYELLFTLPASGLSLAQLAADSGTPVTLIGEITDAGGRAGRVVALEHGAEVELPLRRGWDHFA